MTVHRPQLLSWIVHAYTASGGVLGFLALLAAASDDTRAAFLLLMFSLIIDATDGILARRFHVGKHLPNFSGAHLDDVIDVFTYIYVPLFIVAREELLPHPAWLILPLLAGLYAYGQANMKTDDGHFLGFPSYWNVVALYLYWLQPGTAVALALVVIPAVLTFVPTRYLYPSRNAEFWKTNFVFGGIWLAVVCWMLFQHEPPRAVVLASTAYPALYMALSFYVEIQNRRLGRAAAPDPG